jgi:hypothetical protein
MLCELADLVVISALESIATLRARSSLDMIA